MVEHETTNKRRAVVTGASGFVGSRLVRLLAESGWAVHAILRRTSDLTPVAPLAGRISVHLCESKVADLRQALVKAQPDVVFHLASLFRVDHSPDDVCGLIESNVTFGAQLVEAMSLSGVHYLVNAGTSWQHFGGGDYCPVNLYAATKQAFESILEYYVEARDLHVITLKLFDTYGPGDPRGKVIDLLLRAARSGHQIPLSPGEQRLDLLHVDDVCLAFICAGDRLLSGSDTGHQRYELSSGRQVSLRELVAVVEATIGVPVPVEWGARPYRKREVMAPVTWQPRLPGWRSVVQLEDGLRSLWESSGGQTQSRGRR